MNSETENSISRRTDKVILEVCCGSAEDGINAFKGGADRIELNSALELGGLTPTLSALRTVKSEISIPVICMDRPRPGGFFYSDSEKLQMEEDALFLLNEGADGIAFGFLNQDSSIDENETLKMTNLIHSFGKEAVFHRAFDLTPDAQEAYLILKKIGVDRILTSGHQASAVDGLSEIRDLVRLDGPQILPGSGIRKENALTMIEEGNVDQIHSSCRSMRRDTACRKDDVNFGVNISEGDYWIGFTDPDKTEDLARICHGNGEAE